MFKISYASKLGFTLTFNSYIERDEFMELVSFLKSLFLKYNKENNVWILPEKRIDEILLWFQRNNMDYEFTRDGFNELEKINNSYHRELKIFRSRNFEKNLLNSNFKSIPKQEEIIDWCLKRNAYINACSTGLGKTGLEISHVEYLFKNNLCDKFIVIVPLGTGYNWEYQFKDFADYKDEDFGYIENDNKFQPFSNFKDKKIIIISNHIFAKVILSYKKDFDSKKSLKNERWDKCYCDIKKELNCNTLGIIVDESHSFKNIDAIKTKALLSTKEMFDYRFCLTATPNINRFEHIYPQIKFVDNSVIPMTEKAFRLEIASSIGNRFDRYGINAYNTKKVSEFRNKFQDVMIQVMKEDIPEFKVRKHVKPVHNKLHPLQLQMYRRVCEIELNRLQEEHDKVTWQQIINKFPMILKVIDCPSVLKKSVYDDEHLSNLLDKWKLEYDSKFIQLKTILENDIEELDEKVIIFDSSPDILDLLYKHFEKYNPLIIHGSLEGIKDKEKDRTEKVKLFNSDKKYKLFLLSTHTSSSSINLQAMCRRIKFYSVPQDATELRQGIDRTYRITSKEDTLVDIFTYPETLDRIRYERAMNRMSLNDKLTKEISQIELDNLLRGIV